MALSLFGQTSENGSLRKNSDMLLPLLPLRGDFSVKARIFAAYVIFLPLLHILL